MTEPLQPAKTKDSQSRTKNRPYPFQILASRLRRFFDPSNAQVGFRSAFTLAFATLVAAHMPVVVGIGYAPWNLEVLSTLGCLGCLAFAASALLHRLRPLFYLFVCFWLYWALDAYIPDKATLVWASSAMAIFPIDLTTDGWNILQNVFIAAAFWLLFNSRVSDNLRAMVIAFSVVWFAGLWTSSERLLLSPAPGSELIAGVHEHRSTSVAKSPTERDAFHATDGSLRPVIHFILDEQMSPRALPDTVPKATIHPTDIATKETHPAENIIKDYVSRGFIYYSHARSTSNHTHKSLAAMMGMNNQTGEENLNSSGGGEFHHEIKNNLYIDTLTSIGYAVTVVQNNFLMLCKRTESTQCRNYALGRTGDISSNIEIDFPSRLIILLTEVQRAYTNPKSHRVFAYSYIDNALKKIGVEQTYKDVYYSNPLAALNLLQEVREILSSIKPGQAYIAHLLIPHYPFMMDTDCRIKNYKKWTSSNRLLETNESPIPEEEIYRDYWDQSACAHRRVMSMIDMVRNEFDINPIIFVQGDHGSRITGDQEVLAHPSPDNVDMLETFLAVYSGTPDKTGMEITEPLLLQSLFQETIHRLLRPPAGGSI